MSITLQSKLLGVLQEKVVVPVIDTNPWSVDLRAVTATNRDPEATVKQGTFR